MMETLYKLAWNLCSGPVGGLPEHSGTLQLLSHHEDLFQRSFIQRGQGGGLLGFLSSGGETLFSTLSFLALVGTFTFTRNTSLVGSCKCGQF